MKRYFPLFGVLALGAGVGVVSGAACRVAAPNHCANLDGDASCGEGQFCNRCVSENNGCVEGFVDDAACRAGDKAPEPPVTGSGSTSDGTSSGEGPESMGSSSDGGATSSTTAEPPQACERDDDCTEAGEVCNTNTGECVDCYDGVGTIGCDDPDAAGEFCLDNTCVECIDGAPCGGEGLCDVELHQCMPCTAHDQCDVGACQLVGDNEGECFPSDALVVHVDDESAPAGAEEPYFPTMQDAVAAVMGAGGVGVIWVHQGSYSAPDLIDGSATIAVFGVEDSLPTLSIAMAPAFDVSSENTSLYLADISLSDSGVGLRVEDASVHAQRVRFVGNALSGIRAIGSADVYVERSEVVANGSNPGGFSPAADIYVDDEAQLTVENSMIGSPFEGVDALDHRSTGTVTLSHSTLIGGFGDGNAVGCEMVVPMGPMGPMEPVGPVAADASILLTRGDGSGLSCDALTLTRSATVNGDLGSHSVGDTQSDWFVNTANANFHLSSDGADIFVDLIEWQPGDPLVDIDGDARQGVAGEPDFPGADVPLP